MVKQIIISIAFVSLFCCSHVLRAQGTNTPLDSLVAKFEQNGFADCGLRGLDVIDTLKLYNSIHPNNALALECTGRAYGKFGAVGSSSYDMTASEGLALCDSEIHYYELAQKLNPSLRDPMYSITLHQLIGHGYGGKALWHLYTRQIDEVVRDLENAKSKGGFSDALLDYSRLVLAAMPPNSILFTYGDDDTFPLWYLQFVEHSRADVTLINQSLICMSWMQHLVSEGIPKYLQPVPFPQLPGTSDTSRYRSAVDDSIAATAGYPIGVDTIDIAESAKNEMESALGHQLAASIVTNSYRAKESSSDFVVSSGWIVKILKANKWKRQVFLDATFPDWFFKGIFECLRYEGFVSRIFPDKPSPAVSNGLWVDSALYCLSIEKSVSVRNLTDSFVSRYYPNFLALMYGIEDRMDSTDLDRMLIRARPIAQCNSESAATYYSGVLINAVLKGHTALREDLIWVRNTLESSKLENPLYYSGALFALKECDELRNFAVKLPFPTDASDANYSEKVKDYNQVQGFAAKCK